MSQSFIAVLNLFHRDLPLIPTIRSIPSVTIEVEAQPVTATGDGTGPTIFFSLKDADDRDRRTFESALSSDRTVDDWQRVLEYPECWTYKIDLSREAKFTVPEISKLGIRVLTVRSAADSWRLELQAPDRDRLGAYWQYCRDEDVQFSLEKLYSTGARVRTFDGDRFQARLTDRQREVARTATRMGYYEPDGASATEVAAELGISRSTLSTHLRRITSKLFAHVFGS